MVFKLMLRKCYKTDKHNLPGKNFFICSINLKNHLKKYKYKEYKKNEY